MIIYDAGHPRVTRIKQIKKYFRITLAGIALLNLNCAQTSFPPHHLHRATSAETVSSPLAFDFNHDGRKEIVIGSFDGNCYLLDDSLRDLPAWPKFSHNGFFFLARIVAY